MPIVGILKLITALFVIGMLLFAFRGNITESIAKQRTAEPTKKIIPNSPTSDVDGFVDAFDIDPIVEQSKVEVFIGDEERGVDYEDTTENARDLFLSQTSSGSVGISGTNIIHIDGSKTWHTLNGSIPKYWAEGFVVDLEVKHDISPYAGTVVFIDRISSLQATRPSEEYFILRFADRLTRRIDITGWKVVGKNERVAHTIPKALRILGQPQGQQKLEPILVDAGSTVIVASGRSPTGFSFLVNSCSGHRSQFKTFVPSIKTSCSDPLDLFVENATVPYTDTRCYRFVDNLESCRVVTDLPTGVTDACYAFLEEEITEEACVARHINDPGFFSNQWRIFLDSEEELWDGSENILYLLDKQDRLITTYIF